MTQAARPVALQCRSAQQTLGSPCLMRGRGRGGCCAPHAPMPGWRDSAVRRWASSGTGAPWRVGWAGGRSRPDPCPAQGAGPLRAGRADSGRQRHVGLLLRGRGKAAACPEAARGHLRVVRRAAGRWGTHRAPAPRRPTPAFPASLSSVLSGLSFCHGLSHSDCPRGRFLATSCQGETLKFRTLLLRTLPTPPPSAGLCPLGPLRMGLCPLQIPPGQGYVSSDTPGQAMSS